MFVKVSANLPDQCYDFVLNKLAAAKMDDADNYKLVTSCFFVFLKLHDLSEMAVIVGFSVRFNAHKIPLQIMLMLVP